MTETSDPAGSDSTDALHELCRADPLWAERYQGWTPLGHGASAVVVRTHARALGEDIALKVFPHLAEADWRRFQDEVRNAQRLASPFVVRTYSPFPRRSFAWIEQELVDGPDLRHELERRTREGTPFSFQQAGAIASAVGQALVAAHQAGIVHRDVKPANVLLPVSGAPAAKLGDFGISRLAGAARQTHTGLLAGTPQFAAPEVIAGEVAGPPADVYGLGLVAYLLFSGNRSPFELPEDAAPTRWMRAHAEEQPRPLSVVAPGVSRAVATAVDAALAKDPLRRPTAAAMVSALEAGADGGALELKTPASRATSAVAVCVALSMAALGWWQLRRTPPTLPVPIVASPQPALPLTPRAEPTFLSMPPPTPEPRPARVDPAPAFRVSLEQEVLTLTRLGTNLAQDLEISLLFEAGSSARATVPDPLAPGERLQLPLDTFAPSVPPGRRPQRVRLSFVEAGGSRRTITLDLPEK